MVFNLNFMDLTIYNSITYKIYSTRITKLDKILSRIKLRLQYE
jgi:hypothetical protein